jgi:hypothetical protein
MNMSSLNISNNVNLSIILVVMFGLIGGVLLLVDRVRGMRTNTITIK